MPECLSPRDFVELSDSSLRSFDSEIALIPDSVCAPFYDAAGRLEAQLLVYYRVAVALTKKEEDIVEVADIWDAMVLLCDHFARRLQSLVAAHPYCGAGIFYDQILELRSKCQRLAMMHR